MDQSYLKRLERKTNNRKNNNMGIVDPATEWIKWLEYIPEFEEKKLNKIYKKKVKDLTLDEINFLKTFKEREEMLDLIKKYQCDKCDEEDFLKVYKCINSPIINLMLEKLSKDELQEAKTKINDIKDFASEDIQKMKENYSELNMVDSYILHIALDMDFINKHHK